MNDSLKNPKPLPPPSKYLNRSRGMLIRNCEEKDLEIQALNDRIKQIEARESAMIGYKTDIEFLNEEINKIKSFLVL